jgi:uroporphyrinogen-III synthase
MKTTNVAVTQLLVTRPQPQADVWVRDLRALGVPARALPLLAIEPAPEPKAREAWDALARYGLVMFVSPNAVQSFFALCPSGCAWPAPTRAGSTGPGTTQALLDAGVPPQSIDEPARVPPVFESEALWQQRLAARNWQQVRVLVVRGDGGREWLAEQLRAAGAQVELVRVYRRALPHWSAEQQALASGALAAPERSVWLLSSSQAVEHLRSLLPQAAGPRTVAWATHERIAQAARAFGFGTVHSVAPALHDVAASWAAKWGRSIQSNAPPDQRP